MYTLVRWFRRLMLLRKAMVVFGLLGAGGGAYVGIPHIQQALAQPGEAKVQASGEMTVGFSPGNAEALVVDVIKRAAKGGSLEVAAYEFTSKPVAEAILAAHRRGVRVRVVVDQERLSGKYNAGTYLANNHVPLRASNPRYKIFHHKFVIVDGKTLQTGSFNYTTAAAKSNAENVLVMWDAPAVAAVYAKEFERIWMESQDAKQKY